MYTLFNNIVSDTIHSVVVCVDFLGTHIASLVLFLKLDVTSSHLCSGENNWRKRRRGGEKLGLPLSVVVCIPPAKRIHLLLFIFRPKFPVPLAVHDGFVTFSLDRNDRRVVVARIALSWRREGRSGSLGICHYIRCVYPT